MQMLRRSGQRWLSLGCGPPQGHQGADLGPESPASGPSPAHQPGQVALSTFHTFVSCLWGEVVSSFRLWAPSKNSRSLSLEFGWDGMYQSETWCPGLPSSHDRL